MQLLGSGTILREVIAGGGAAEEGLGRDRRRLELPELQRAAARRHRGRALEHAASRRRSRAPRTSSSASRGTKGPVIAATDYMRTFADQIRAFVPRRYVVLGTDGFGRTDTREKLRRFFEVNRHYVAVAALKALADDGELPAAKVAEAIEKYGIDPEQARALDRVSGRTAPQRTKNKHEESALAAIEVKVPDIGDFKDIPVIEVLVKPGDAVKKDDSLVTLESRQGDDGGALARRRASVKELKVKVGDKVSEGTLIADARGRAARRPRRGQRRRPAPAARRSASPAPPQRSGPVEARSRRRARRSRRPPPRLGARRSRGPPRPPRPRRSREGAAPRTRARPCAASRASSASTLAQVKGTGPKGRILKEDVQGFVKQRARRRRARAAPAARRAAASPTSGCPRGRRSTSRSSARSRRKPLSRIQKISGPTLPRNWVMIPHVTQFDEADITELEAFRAKVNEENAKAGIKVTPLAFLMKAVVAALKKFPTSTLARRRQPHPEAVLPHRLRGRHAERPRRAGDQGRRPEGRARDRRRRPGELAAKAREGKLGPADMQGGTFSISSLGGIGGTAFTPIINAPEVAILGVSKVGDEAGVERQGVRAAPHAAAVALLRPPRDRRRARPRASPRTSPR